MLQSNPLMRRLFACCALLAGVLLLGTFGYMMLENWSTQEGFFMSVITLSTVGYSETRELSPVGRMFTTGLICVSIVCLSCWTASLTSLFVEGDLSGAFRRKRTKKMVASMSGHTIVCGSGLMAQTIVDRLTRNRQQVVVVDSDQENIELIRRRYPKVPIIDSPAIDEMSLADANVLTAQSIVATLDSDFDNLLIVMTCKDLGTNIKVVARSDDTRVASRMLKAGVDEVICPFQLSGEHVASLLAS